MPITFSTYEFMAELKLWHGISEPDNEDAITTENCRDWMNQSRRRFGQKVLECPYTEREDSFATQVGVREYDLPYGWYAFESLYYMDGDGNQQIIAWYPKKKVFDKTYPDRTKQGAVKGATQWGLKMILGLVPDEVITIYRSYRGLALALTRMDDYTTDEFLKYEWETLMWGALVVSGEHEDVPNEKLAEWKDRWRAGISAARKIYKTGKIPPGPIVSSAPGNVFPVQEE